MSRAIVKTSYRRKSNSQEVATSEPPKGYDSYFSLYRKSTFYDPKDPLREVKVNQRWEKEKKKKLKSLRESCRYKRQEE